MRCSSDACLCESSGAAEQLETLIVPSLDWQTCMHERGAVLWEMYCAVQGQGRRGKNPQKLETHSMNYWNNRLGKANRCLALVGKLYLWAVKLSVSHPGTDRRALLYYVCHFKNTVVSVTYARFHSHAPLRITSGVPTPPGIKALSCTNSSCCFLVFGGGWSGGEQTRHAKLMRLPEKYVCRACTAFPDSTLERLWARSH